MSAEIRAAVAVPICALAFLLAAERLVYVLVVHDRQLGEDEATTVEGIGRPEHVLGRHFPLLAASAAMLVVRDPAARV